MAAVSVLEEGDVDTGEEFGRSRQRVLLILRVDVVERKRSHEVGLGVTQSLEQGLVGLRYATIELDIAEHFERVIERSSRRRAPTV